MGSQAVRIYGAGDATGIPFGTDPAKPLYSSSGTYRRSAAVGATAGDALLAPGLTTAGTITATLVGGGSL